MNAIDVRVAYHPPPHAGCRTPGLVLVWGKWRRWIGQQTDDVPGVWTYPLWGNFCPDYPVGEERVIEVMVDLLRHEKVRFTTVTIRLPNGDEREPENN